MNKAKIVHQIIIIKYHTKYIYIYTIYTYKPQSTNLFKLHVLKTDIIPNEYHHMPIKSRQMNELNAMDIAQIHPHPNK